MPSRSLLVTLLVTTVVACGTAPEGSDAGNPPGADASDVSPDAGEVVPDAGEVVPDAGEGTPDAGNETPDAGSGPVDWETVGARNLVPEGVSEPHLTASSTGQPYVAFSDNSQAGKTSVMTFNGTSWAYVGAAGLSDYGNNRFPNVVLHDGQPWVAYQQNVPGNKVWVKRFDGTSWLAVGSGAVSAGESAFPSLAFDSAGTPHVAFRDYVNASKTTVMKFDGTNWVAVGSVGISSDAAWMQALAFDGLTPYVAYATIVGSAPANVTVQKFSEGAWSVVGGVGISASEVGYLDFAVDEGTPYLFYGGKAKTDETAVRRFDGTGWVKLGSIGRSAMNSVVSLAVDDGTAFIAFKDWDNANFAPSVMRWNGTAWSHVGAATTTGSNDDSLALAVGGGRVFLGFRDNSGSPKSVSVIQIAR